MRADTTLGLPRYEVGSLTRFPGLAYAHPRPFRNWTAPQMNAAIGGWLSGNPPSLELATLALAEMRRRREELPAEMKFAARRLEPVPWLEEAGEAVRNAFPPHVLNSQKQGRLGGHVYVVLRGGYSAANGWYGCYVGSTGKSPAARIREHRAGGRTAARGLPRHGIEPLWSLFDFINPVPKARGGREEWETRLHEALAPVVPKVTGDVAF